MQFWSAGVIPKLLNFTILCSKSQPPVKHQHLTPFTTTFRILPVVRLFPQLSCWQGSWREQVSSLLHSTFHCQIASCCAGVSEIGWGITVDLSAYYNRTNRLILYMDITCGMCTNYCYCFYYNSARCTLGVEANLTFWDFSIRCGQYHYWRKQGKGRDGAKTAYIHRCQLWVGVMSVSPFFRRCSLKNRCARDVCVKYIGNFANDTAWSCYLNLICS
jgi:hypothetical protein